MSETTGWRAGWRRLPTGLRIFYLFAVLAMALALVLLVRGNDRWASMISLVTSVANLIVLFATTGRRTDSSSREARFR